MRVILLNCVLSFQKLFYCYIKFNVLSHKFSAFKLMTVLVCIGRVHFVGSDKNRHTMYFTFYLPQGKVMFSEASVILSRLEEEAVPLNGEPLWQETSWRKIPLWRETHGRNMGPDRKWHHTPPLERTWDQIGSNIIHPHWYWHLVAATATVRMHHTGMHSCFSIRVQSIYVFLLIQFFLISSLKWYQILTTCASGGVPFVLWEFVSFSSAKIPISIERS